MTESKCISVLVLTSTFPRWQGDAEPLFVDQLSRRLAQCGMRVTVLAPRAPGAAENETWDDGVSVVRYPYFLRRYERLAYEGGILAKLKALPLLYLLIPFFLLGQCLALISLCRKHHFDVIHAHWIFPQGFLALLATKVMRRPIPIVVTSHGGDLYGLRQPLLQKIKQWTLCKADRVSVVSHAMCREVATITDGKVEAEILSMGVDLRQTFTPDVLIRREPRHLLLVGRLVEKKGVDVLLRALPEIHRNFKDLRVTIVGDGPERSHLEYMAKDLGMTGIVNFVGRRPNCEIADFYRAAGIFVMPSVVASSGDQEGLGLVAVEAMGCGCLVVASDLDAIKDVVDDGVTGVLFPAGNYKALASVLLKLFESSDSASSLAATARQYVLARYDWQFVAERYARLLILASSKLS